MRVEMTIKLTIEAEEIIDREVRKHGTGPAIYVPRSWIGERVKVIRLGRIQHKAEQEGRERREGGEGKKK